MKNISLVVSLFVLLLSSGCSRKITQSTESVKHDSEYTHVTERITDTLVTIKGDSANINTPLFVVNGKVADLKPITKKSNQASVTVQVRDGVLTADAVCDEVQILLQQVRTDIERYRQLTQSNSQHIEIAVPYIPKWARVFIVIGIASILIGIVATAIFIHNKIHLR